MGDRLLTQSEVKAIIGVSDGALEQRRHRGMPPKFVTLGRTVRYKESDVLEFIASFKPRKPVVAQKALACKRGHLRTPENTGPRGQCKECMKIWRANKYQKNREKEIAAGCRYSKENREKVRERGNRWFQNNKERMNNYQNERRKNCLPRDYVASSLRIKVKDLPEELYALKRNHILLKRALKDLKKGLED
jgi:predicted DNA-binding transcriptional regulator AlpA